MHNELRNKKRNDVRQGQPAFNLGRLDRIQLKKLPLPLAVPKVDGLVKRLVREEPLLSDSTKDAWIREVIRWKPIGDRTSPERIIREATLSRLGNREPSETRVGGYHNPLWNLPSSNQLSGTTGRFRSRATAENLVRHSFRFCWPWKMAHAQ